MRYILTGGGSGGHIYHLISFANVVKTIDKEAEFLYVGKKDKMEAEIVPAAGLTFVSITTTGTKGRISWQNVKAATQMGIGYLQAKKIIKDFNPDVCLGGGGYVSVPLMLAAITSKKPIVTAVLESDLFMGKANIQLAKKSDLIFSSLFDLKEKYFKNNENYYHVGHPRMEELGMRYVNQIEKKKNKFTIDEVLFVGGSLGAKTINEQALDFCAYLQKQGNRQIHVTVITGKRFYDDYKNAGDQFANLTVLPYSDNISEQYLATDLVVTRASGGVLAETTTMNIPAIMIPSPNVMLNHQFYNAEYFASRHAGLYKEEKNIVGDSLAAFIYDVCQNTEQLKTLKTNLQVLNRESPVTTMYNLIKEEKNKQIAKKS